MSKEVSPFFESSAAGERGGAAVGGADSWVGEGGGEAEVAGAGDCPFSGDLGDSCLAFLGAGLRSSDGSFD